MSQEVCFVAINWTEVTPFHAVGLKQNRLPFVGELNIQIKMKSSSSSLQLSQNVTCIGIYWSTEGHCWDQPGLLLTELKGVSLRFSVECPTEHEALRWNLVFTI